MSVRCYKTHTHYENTICWGEAMDEWLEWEKEIVKQLEVRLTMCLCVLEAHQFIFAMLYYQRTSFRGSETKN